LCLGDHCFPGGSRLSAIGAVSRNQHVLTECLGATASNDDVAVANDVAKNHTYDRCD
jgi:hypothetical protein